MPTITATALTPKATKAKQAAAQRFKQAQRASILLKHASDPTRLHLLLLLSEGEMYVGALCESLALGQAAVSHHLALLRHAGIIAPRRDGKNNYYALTETGEELLDIVKSVMA